MLASQSPYLEDFVEEPYVSSCVVCVVAVVRTFLALMRICKFFIRTSSCILQQLAQLTSHTAGIHCGW